MILSDKRQHFMQKSSKSFAVWKIFIIFAHQNNLKQ